MLLLKKSLWKRLWILVLTSGGKKIKLDTLLFFLVRINFPRFYGAPALAILFCSVDFDSISLSGAVSSHCLDLFPCFKAEDTWSTGNVSAFISLLLFSMSWFSFDGWAAFLARCRGRSRDCQENTSLVFFFFSHFPTSGRNFSLSVSLKPLWEELGFTSTCNTKRYSRFCVLYRSRMLRLECVLQLTLIRMCESWECSGWTSPIKEDIAFLREACVTLRFSPHRLLLLTVS